MLEPITVTATPAPHGGSGAHRVPALRLTSVNKSHDHCDKFHRTAVFKRVTLNVRLKDDLPTSECSMTICH